MARPEIRPASFRGVPFTPVSVEDSGGGRRVEVHQFPFRDQPYTEDFGAQPRTFSIECFVPWSERARLKAACAAPGPGPLVHPFLGTLQVVCIDAKTKDSTSSANLTYFTLSFADAGTNEFPEAIPSTGPQVSREAAKARTTLRSTFVAGFDTPAPQWVTDSSVARVTDLGAAVDSAARKVPGGIGLDAFNTARRALADAAGLVADPNALASAISVTIQRMAGLSTDPLSTFRMLEGFAASVGSSFAVISTALGSRGDESRRQNALARIARSSAVVEASIAASAIPLDSYNAASALRGRIVELFDGELSALGDSGEDDALEALLRLRARVLDDLRARGGALAAVRAITLASTVPAVVLAYRLYGDADRDAEIVARNGIRHPGFIPAAVPLEVLSA